MADAPIHATLHLGPQARATVSIAFIGTKNRFVLTRDQIQQLHAELDLALKLIREDSGESQHVIAHNLGKAKPA